MPSQKPVFSVFAFLSALLFVGCLFWLQDLLPDLTLVFTALRYVLIVYMFVIAAKRKKLSLFIFAAMIAGVEVGMDFPPLAKEMGRFGKIFLNLIKSLVAPLVFATLVVGIAGHSNLKQLGRIGLKSILYFEIVTTVALFIGLMAINLSEAGVGYQAPVKVEQKTEAQLAQEREEEQKMKAMSPAQMEKYRFDKQVDSLVDARIKTNAKAKEAEDRAKKDHIVDAFPENIAKAISENNVLQIVVFAVLFAVGLGMVKHQETKQTMLNFFEGLSEVMFKFTDIVMYLAPLAVFGAIASTVANSGTEILGNLMKLVGTLYVGLIVFVLGVLFPIALFFKVPIRNFLNSIYEPVSLAFATASSESALPIAMENLEKMGVSKKVVGFVLPTGYSFNLDGTTLYLSMATVFVAQMCGAQLSIGEQIGICLTLMLTSKGVAGVRGASFVILTGAVAGLGLDPEKASVILAVDTLMDMGRTSVNVLGNCLATVVIARSEDEFHPELISEELTE